MRTGATICLDYEKWSQVKDVELKRMLGQIKDRFHFEDTNVNRWLESKCQMTWRRVKSCIKKKHFIPGATIYDQYNKCPADLDPKQWKGLVNYWRTKKAESIRAQAQANRRKVEVLHHMGTDSYATRRMKMTVANNGVPPSDLDLFIDTHLKKDTKQLQPSAQALVVAVERKLSQIPEEIVNDTAKNQAFSAVVGGPKHGHVPFVGLLPPNTVIIQQRASLAESALAASERATREVEIVKSVAAEAMRSNSLMASELVAARSEVQLLKERLDAMQRAQEQRDKLHDAGMAAFIARYVQMDTVGLGNMDLEGFSTD